MKELVLIKLGGSIITDKNKEFSLKPKNLERLVDEIKKASKLFDGNIVVGHGAGSFAHRPASEYQTKKGLINKNSLFGMSIVEDAARRLNAIVVKKFIDKKLPVFPFSPGSFAISDTKGGVKSYTDPVISAIKINAIPVVYGDVVMDLKTGFTIFSTEKVLSILAKKLHKNFKIKMIYVTDVDGVYDESHKTIKDLNSQNFKKIKASIVGAKNVDVTGGMIHKVEQSLLVAKKLKIPTLIINGKRDGELQNAIVGKKTFGTTIS